MSHTRIENGYVYTKNEPKLLFNVPVFTKKSNIKNIKSPKPEFEKIDDCEFGILINNTASVKIYLKGKNKEYPVYSTGNWIIDNSSIEQFNKHMIERIYQSTKDFIDDIENVKDQIKIKVLLLQEAVPVITENDILDEEEENEAKKFFKDCNVFHSMFNKGSQLYINRIQQHENEINMISLSDGVGFEPYSIKSLNPTVEDFSSKESFLVFLANNKETLETVNLNDFNIKV